MDRTIHYFQDGTEILDRTIHYFQDRINIWIVRSNISRIGLIYGSYDPIFPGYEEVEKIRFPIFPGYEEVEKLRFPISLGL